MLNTVSVDVLSYEFLTRVVDCHLRDNLYKEAM